jgi:hypothetical protein
LKKTGLLIKHNRATSATRQFQFNKRAQLFTGARHETLSIAMRAYEVRPRKDKRGVDLISDVLPFGRLWYGGPKRIRNAVAYAKFYSRSHNAVIRVLR